MTQSELLVALRQLHFTPMERRILGLLCDGRRHDSASVRERAYPDDDLATPSNLNVHITNIRNKLRDINHTILTEYSGGTMYYQYVVFETIVADLSPQ